MSAASREIEHAPASAGALSQSLPEEWRSYFLKLLGDVRFPGGRRFLRRDIIETMQRLVPSDARVLEVGVGGGHVLAALPNAVRRGVDILPEAIASARALDPSMQLEQADVLTMSLGEKYDAIICDRLIHSVPDVQRMLDNLVAHLSDEGRIYLTCFNFFWSGPMEIGSKLGLHEPSPPNNWFSESDLANIFTLSGLEQVHHEDRVLVPAQIPGEHVVNRVLAKFQPFRNFSFYRTIVLRRARVVRPTNPSVSVVIPARNESGNIEAAVRRTPVMGKQTEIIFVEGGSTDDTWQKIQEVCATYRGPLKLKMCQQTGKGKADAVRAGFALATGDILMILDADLTVPPEELPKFYDIMARGLADYVHGTRLVYPMEDEAMRFLNRLGNAFFARAFAFLLDQPIKDTLCGTKVIWRHDYDRLAANRKYFGDFDPFGDFDLIFGAAKLGLKIMEIPIRYKSRTYGETNISRFRHGAILLRMSAFAARKIKFI